VNRPTAISEVALQLAEDRRHRVAHERPEIRVEAIDRLQQTEISDLLEVLPRLGRVAIAGRQTLGHGAQ
jgi:hypothetical protein